MRAPELTVLQCFSDLFTKGSNFVTSCLPSKKESILKGMNSLKVFKELNEKGEEKENFRVTCLKTEQSAQ